MDHAFVIYSYKYFLFMVFMYFFTLLISREMHPFLPWKESLKKNLKEESLEK